MFTFLNTFHFVQHLSVVWRFGGHLSSYEWGVRAWTGLLELESVTVLFPHPVAVPIAEHAVGVGVEDPAGLGLASAHGECAGRAFLALLPQRGPDLPPVLSVA